MGSATFESFATAVALDRYDVITSLVKRILTNSEFREESERAATSLHLFKSTGKTVRPSLRTIQRWYSWYTYGRRNDRGILVSPPGLDALKPARRSDSGVARAIPAEILERAERLRREDASRTTAMVIELIKAEHAAEQKDLPLIAEATLARHLRKRYASRRALKREGRAFPRWERPHRNALWQADWSDGISLPHPTQPEKRRMTYLHAILDDHTRYIVHAEFYFHENLMCLADCFRKALLGGGVPETSYWDNGKVYHSRQMQWVAARLGMEVVFATPYAPEGKGKIERWFKTVQESFYPEARRANIATLEELNQFFQGWLATHYHARHHASLGDGETPRQRWEAEAQGVRAVDPALLIELFLMEEPRTVDKTGCIKVRGYHYPVHEHLVGKKVTVRFDPYDLSRVRIYWDGSFVQTSEPQQPATRTHRKAEPKKPAPPSILPSAERYRKRMSDSVQEEVDRVVDSARQGGRSFDYLTRPELLAMLKEALRGRVLSVRDGHLIADFFAQNAPLRASTTRAALLRAVDEKGVDRHLRFYLDAVQQARCEEDVQ